MLIFILYQDKVAEPEERSHTSEQEYSKWIEEGSNSSATSLPYGESTFGEAWKQLYQHRSIAHAIRRTSTALFTCHAVAPWKSKPEWGPAVIYNCKSDTESLVTADDILLSLTHFPQKQMIFAVFYGCTSKFQNYISEWFRYAKASASDPLFLPMMFAEFERQRLLNMLDTKGDDLRKRIIDLENKIRQDRSRHSEQSSHSERDLSNQDIAQRECEAVRLWVSVSTLKNGLESLKMELMSMLETSKKPLENDIPGPHSIKPNSYTSGDISRRHSSDSIQARLHDMIVEINTIIRRSSSLLVGMSLATQTESNYLTRMDAWATMNVAVESKRDSSHMRYISKLGMIFLPGTFFATLFSMGFFRWIPDQSDQMVSPYLAIWMGITIFSTLVTWWRFQKFAKDNNVSDVTLLYAQFDKPARKAIDGSCKHVATDIP
ncbi:hypothetical protein F5Y08DRAFT_349861 [Xylaria arbuscula]|nr:hypothetical protein F5Y08DRAFT_349861 [Xylaria arbuscula]